MYTFAIVCLSLLACCAADVVDDIPIDNIVASADGKQLNAKYPAKDDITLVIIHMNPETFSVPNAGKWSTPIITSPKEGFFQSTVTTDIETKGKSIFYWVRLEKKENGKSVGHNSGVRNVTVA